MPPQQTDTRRRARPVSRQSGEKVVAESVTRHPFRGVEASKEKGPAVSRRAR